MADDIYASGPVSSADRALLSQGQRARERSKLVVGADFLGWKSSAQPHETTPESSTIQETPQAPEVDSIEECDEGAIDADVNDSGDRGYCSDDSELPSLEELLSQARQGSGTGVSLDLKSTTASEQLEFIDRRDGGSGTGSETGAFPGIDAARGMFSSGNQDNPTVLDESEDEDDSQRRAVAPGHDDSNLDIAYSVDRDDSSLLSIIPTVTDGAHGTPSSPGDHTLQNSADGEEGGKKHENNRSSRESGGANEEPADGSEGQEIPASTGHIHDIFADYEQRFSTKNPNQQAQRQRTTRHPSTRAGSHQTVLSSFSAKQSVCGDGSQTSSTGDVGIEEHTRVEGHNTRLSCSPEANTADEPASQSGQDSEEQLPSPDGVGIFRRRQYSLDSPRDHKYYY
ncbi:hypothetical protein UCRPC4_g06697 [Phaeomoniella chlamydospora]|uniref:Uncharacterized protein n=1 Tax=Phaeomoniella chlamydospora TaxID=158046 RepID=A0A0G2DUF5_PHACM|nr:hypothetical protein UCRPC4_g06697 [Phaeomoniella chlamydospora]